MLRRVEQQMIRYVFTKIVAFLFSCINDSRSLAEVSPARASKPKGLFIAIDDLRPALVRYVAPLAKSPNIEAGCMLRGGERFATSMRPSVVCALFSSA